MTLSEQFIIKIISNNIQDIFQASEELYNINISQQKLLKIVFKFNSIGLKIIIEKEKLKNYYEVESKILLFINNKLKKLSIYNTLKETIIEDKLLSSLLIDKIIKYYILLLSYYSIYNIKIFNKINYFGLEIEEKIKNKIKDILGACE